MIVTLTNDRGETIPFPPEGITVRQLFESFGDMRLNFITAAASADQAVAVPELPTVQTEEMNGLIEDPSAQTYTLIQKASYGSQVTTFAAKLGAGTATVKVLADSTSLGTFNLTTNENTFSIFQDLAAGATLSLQITAAASASNLAFTVGFQR